MIRWSKRAFADFKAIHDYIATDQPEAARKQCTLIYASIHQLHKFPQSGRRGRIADDRTLAVPGTPYLLTYTVKKNTILFRRIRHGAQFR